MVGTGPVSKSADYSTYRPGYTNSMVITNSTDEHRTQGI